MIGPEDRLQRCIFDLLNLRGRRDWLYIAIPNGDLRSINVAVRLKAQGVMPGVPDIQIIMDGGKSAWLELKSEHGALSHAQKSFRARLQRLGHPWAMARSYQEAIDVLHKWGVFDRQAVSIEREGIE